VFHEVEKAEALRAVHAALDHGINYLDVSPAYGATQAERYLGAALQQIDRGRYYLSTKVGKHTQPGGYGMDTFDFSRDSIIRSIDESMGRLGVDYFDIVYLHDFDYENGRHADQALTEGFETLVELKNSGRIGATGAGIYAMDLWKRALLETEVDVLLVHNHYCLNDIRALELLPLCDQLQVGIVNASPFGSGLLTDRGAPQWHPCNDQQRELFAQASEYCKESGTSISKVALQFSTQNSRFPTTLFSTARVSSVERNIAWYEEPCDYKLVAAIQRILEPVMNLQWDY
jgi:aryl-alcohol dehydrogenase-like predicted oxidoreductase